MKIKITPSNITKLKKNEVFVFGSNLLGNHAGGAAKLAVDQFGAQMGNALGIQGQSFAIPTLDESMEKASLSVIKDGIVLLTSSAKLFPKLKFLVTEIGCGIAGFSAAEIAPLFEELFKSNPANVSFPQSFIDVLSLSKEPTVPGYKGFDKGLNCRGYQYAENAEFLHNRNPSLCNHGFHFCENPLDVFNYYPPEIGREYAKVEAFGAVQKEGDKTATNKLRVNAKISLGNLFKLHFDLVFDKVKTAIEKIKASEETTTTAGESAHANTAGNYAHANTAGESAHANTAGNYAHANTAGESAHANTAGNYAHANTAGESAHANTAGNYAHANTAGNYAHANTAGNYAHANTAGNYAHANTAGESAHANTAGNYAHANTAGESAHANTAGNYAHANTAGESAHANTAGNYAHANTAGNYAHANTAGNYAHANTAGYYAHANTAGYYAHACVKGSNSIAVALGIEGHAKGALGCWIVVTEWKQEPDYTYSIVEVKTAKVDWIYR
ncbi:DUF7666 domain-containing protein [Mucilaginibacter sp. SP1R1]|uniref:A1S_2505 family phage non-structural protein n=1 Tax=Mucilaginibacter sp. SP1R1 TaxID=2723091 RepID=UPI003B009E73